MSRVLHPDESSACSNSRTHYLTPAWPSAIIGPPTRRTKMPLHRKVTKPRDDMIEKIVESTRKRMEAERAEEHLQSPATDEAGETDARETSRALRPRMRDRRSG